MGVADLNQRLANLSPAKKALLELRLKQNRLHEQTIPPRASREFAPLSFAQQRLWFLNQLEPESPAYNESRAYRLSGVLAMAALQGALDQVVARHEVLRTNFVSVDGNPTQVIGEARPVELPLIDLGAWPESGREAEARRLLAENVRRPFDLSRDLMLRVMLLRLDEQEHILLVVKHHIASDGWSSGIFWRDLADLYRSFISGEPFELFELPIQYADFAVWQRNRLQGEFLEAQLSYWKTRLDGVEPLRLPTDRRHSATPTPPGAKQSLTLPKELSEGLVALSRQQGATLFMTLLAAFQTLLSRYTGQTDIAVGTPIAGRTRLEVEKLIGFFVNTLVLRTDCSNDPTFRELLERVRQKALEAYAYQEVPFEKIVEELQPERKLGSSPLFQVTFQLQNTPRSSIDFPGLALSPVEVTNGAAKFDLSLSMGEERDGLKATLDYNTDLLDGATIRRMLGHLRVLLEGIVADPDRPISALPILTEPERHQLLVEWNDTKREYPKDKCIHELFEEQVKRTPDAAAVVFEGEQLTYRELNAKANRLAYHLRKQGVGPDVPVGLCVERSLDMIMGILGILKAGGVYVPLDPDYPKDRVEFMMEDAKLSFLVTQERFRSGFPDSGVRMVCLDADWEIICRGSDENPGYEVTADNLAYLIYTSGSSGVPKGVLITHSSFAGHCLEIRKHYALEPNDRVLQFASFNFDVSLEEIFPTLISGAALVLNGAEMANPTDFHNMIADFKLSVLNLPTAYWRQLTQVWTAASSLDLPASVRLFIVGGEAMPIQALKSWRQTPMNSVRLLNAYGPTETTITATALETLSQGFGDQQSDCVPIGRPLGNRETYILDTHGGPVPIGVPGELHIGGDGLAWGYLNRPELTAEKFIPNPFSGEPGARLYKTGDLARYLPDGNIEFLGRIDNQVKIRGFRIEPGEIEAVLSRHPAVKEIVVAAREDVPGQKRLVGYVVASQQPPPTGSDLRGFLRHKLPDYMIPSAFVFLESLPLSPNGKVDRKALPVPDQSRPELEESFVAPRTAVEEILAEIWAELLKVENVGVHDNFFDLGGHSLLAAQLISRVRDAFHVEVPLRSLFEAPTVAGLALGIEAARQGQTNPASLPIVPVPCTQESPLSFSQMRFWLLSQLQPNSFIHNCTDGFRLKGALNVKALEQTFEEIVRRHEVLRTTFSMSNGEPIQRVAEQWSVKLPIMELTELRGADLDAEVWRLFENEFHRPFNLSADLMLRAIVLRLNDSEHVLILTIHHIAIDHWSSKALYRELSVIYQACLAGRPCPLPEPPIQYKHYAIWQRQMFADAAFANHLAYWKRQLRDSPPMLNLPTDHPRPLVQSFRGERVALNVSPALVDALKALSREAGVTLFMTLLAAFKVLLSRLSGQEDIVVGSPVAGRERSETEDLIGLFLNTLVLRTDLSGNPTFRQLLTRVREVALGAYDHQDLPFEKLMEELKPGRDLSRTPLFQVFFNLYNFAEAGLDLAGLSVTPFHVTEPVSNFDLTLYVRERQGTTRLFVVYNADLFAPDRMNEMLAQLNHLLCQVVENPDQRIRDISLVTASAMKYLPDPTQPLKSDWTGAVHTRFSQQAQRSPEHVAILSRQEIWTYKELDSRSNQLANCLLANGIQSEDVVAIYGHRSPSLVWAVLGILKSGAAFLILDPTYPAARVIDCLRMAKPRGWLQLEAAGTVPDELEEFIAASSLRCHLELPRLAAALSRDPLGGYAADDPGVIVGPDDLAYVAFTSGSTGRPKGILGKHGSLSHFLPWQMATFKLSVADRFSMLSGLSHDPLQRDIFTPLWFGATICIPDPEIVGTPELAQWMADERVTFAHLTPPMAQLLVESATAGCCLPSLRYAFFVGDKLTRQDVSRLRRLAPQVTCINSYGTTETQRAVGYYAVPPEPEVQGRRDNAVYPLGRGMEDVQVLVLTAGQQLAGVGEIGEIYFRSPHLAQGYLGDEALTQARFLTNPFTGVVGDRLYKTGDLGRYLADGNVEFAGRADNQVKIRGFRIEPGEIEAVFSQHPAVKEIVVAAREDVPGQKRLVGYVGSNQQSIPTTNELRTFLKQKLPEYMIPSAFVFLGNLPLTPNGKVDYAALPDPSDELRQAHNLYCAPRDETEKIICRVWSEVLGITRVGIDDDFFAIGGHSLLASKLFSRLDEEIGCLLPLGVLFSAPTVRTLAEHYRMSKKPRKLSTLVALATKGSLPPVYAVPGVYGNVVGYADLSRELGPEQPFFAFQSIGLDGEEPSIDSVEKMARRYIGDLRTAQPQGPYILIGACFGASVAYEMAWQLLEAGEEVRFLGLLDPSRREGRGANGKPTTVPRIVKRVRALSSLVTNRLETYRSEMLGFKTADCVRFLSRKISLFAGKISPKKAVTGIKREIFQIEVAEANLLALTLYKRKPLEGRLQALEIFESNHPRNTGKWDIIWDGQPVCHHVGGENSGDMLTGENVRVLASLLAQRLRVAHHPPQLQGSAKHENAQSPRQD